jgi:hypothetical protein
MKGSINTTRIIGMYHSVAKGSGRRVALIMI